MTFGRQWMVAALLPLLIVAGCSEEPEPVIEPPETTSAAGPSTTPEPKEPWERKTRAGAVAFAEHWFEVFSQVMADGDVRPLERLSDAQCESCANVSDRLRSIYEAGGFYRSDGWRVVQADVVDADGRAVVALRVLRSAEVLRESAESQTIRNPASRASYNAELRWSDGQWLMHRLDLLT